MKIGVLTKNNVNPAYGAARAGADKIGARLGVQVLHYVPEHPDDADEQAALLLRAVDARVDAIVAAPVLARQVTDALRAASASGIPLFGFVSRVDPVDWTSFVGSDDCRLAKQLALRVFRDLPGGGHVVIVDGSPESQTSLDRRRGFDEAIASTPAIRLVASCNGRYQLDTAKSEFAAVLRRVRRVDAVLAANDMMALGVVAALHEAGRKALVGGVNAIPEAITAIKNGSMVATADFNAMQLAATATECAIRHLRGEKVPARIELAVQIVDRHNVTLWDRPFEERRLMDWEEIVLPTGQR
jgi:ribose transport system substrate-binding protein